MSIGMIASQNRADTSNPAGMVLKPNFEIGNGI
jgi:hypothetical protein